MPTHWTYDSHEPADDLEQGDILEPTDRLRAVFSEVHPHFTADKYLGFLVTTQSCDLVRRRGMSKAPYLNVAAIRPLTQVAHKILCYAAEPVADRTFRTSAKPEARRLLERIVNQNEQSAGLFFLYPDIDAGMAEPAVAFLRVTVALRQSHYDALREARVGRLKPEFRAKLGWLVGNLFVRPATPDWNDVQGGRALFREVIRQVVDDVRWIDDEIVDVASAKGIDVSIVSLDELEAFRPPSHLERALLEVHAELSRVAPDLSEDKATKLANRLRNNGKFKKLFGPARRDAAASP